MGKELEDLLKQMSADVLELNQELVNSPIVDTLRKGNKYHNEQVEWDGLKFDSKKEGRRYAQLVQMEQTGLISNLRLQVAFELQPGFETRDGERIRAIHYVADFVYERDGVLVVEDVKSEITRKQPLFVIKWKMLRYKYRYSPNMRFVLT